MKRVLLAVTLCLSFLQAFAQNAEVESLLAQ
jgi:hypothetical protein